MRVNLALYGSYSLKDKRRVIRGLLTRLVARFNVSAVEVDARDSHQRCVLGLAVVGVDTRGVHHRLDKIVDFIRAQPGASLVDYEREIYY